MVEVLDLTVGLGVKDFVAVLILQRLTVVVVAVASLTHMMAEGLQDNTLAFVWPQKIVVELSSVLNSDMAEDLLLFAMNLHYLMSLDTKV